MFFLSCWFLIRRRIIELFGYIWRNNVAKSRTKPWEKSCPGYLWTHQKVTACLTLPTISFHLTPVTYKRSRCWLQLCKEGRRRYFSQSALRNVLTMKHLNPLVLCIVWWHQKGNYTLTDVMLYFFVSGSLPSQLSYFWGYSLNSVYHLSSKLLSYFYYLNIMVISVVLLWRQESNKCPDQSRAAEKHYYILSFPLREKENPNASTLSFL